MDYFLGRLRIETNAVIGHRIGNIPIQRVIQVYFACAHSQAPNSIKRAFERDSYLPRVPRQGIFTSSSKAPATRNCDAHAYPRRPELLNAERQFSPALVFERQALA